MTLQEISKSLRGRNLTDVLLTGFVDKNEASFRFYALLDKVYFECGDCLLEASTSGDSGRIRLVVTGSIRHNAELDDDMAPAITSIGQQILDEPGGLNAIAALRLWNMSEDSGLVECSAVRIDLTNGQRIFVDPSNYFGMRLGGRALEELWASSWFGSDTIQTEIVVSPRDVQ